MSARGANRSTLALPACLVFYSIAVACGFGTSASASSRQASMVIDANTGRVLHASEADEARYPASLTKMMTLYLLFEQIDAGRMTYATKIKMSQEAASAPPSKLDLEPGEELTAISAVKALVTKSANDVAVAVAEHIGGSESAFARRMTDKARQLGMSRTVFKNASGLPDPQQVTTARDMLTLALRLQDDFPKHYVHFSSAHFQYEGNTYRNHNTMLRTYEGVDGIKTGYTRLSGFNLVTSARRSGRHVVAAVFGGETAAARNATMRNLLNRTLLQASSVKTRKAAPVLVAAAAPANRTPRPASSLAPAAAAVPPAPKLVAAPALKSKPPAPVQVAAAPRALGPDGHGDEIGRARDPLAERIFAEAATGPIFSIARVRRVAVEAPVRASVSDSAHAPGPPMQETTDVSPSPMEGARTASFAQVAAALARLEAQTSEGDGSAGQEMATGREPSTFQDQARTLTASNRSDPTPSNRADPTPLAGAPVVLVSADRETAPGAAGVQVQIGAYVSAGEAERALNATRARTGDLLHRFTPVTIPVKKDNRQLYRARFAGFDPETAAATCSELRRQKMDCFVMRN